jgi:pimeloyl-ACP methyl ester carboxylesterase
MISDHLESIKNIKIHYLKNGISPKEVLLLHGYSFNANTWRDLKTLEILENENIGVVALDFPGFGGSEKLKNLNYNAYPFRSNLDIRFGIEFLKIFIDLNFDKASIVGPSMGGQLAINYLITYPLNVCKLVLIGPVGFKQENILESLKILKNEVLIMRGKKDSITSERDVLDLKNAIENSSLIQYSNAGHPCYLDVPDQFHRDLSTFLKK